MSILRKIMLTMTAAAALLTIPSAAFASTASTASPAAVTRAAAPVSIAKPADPGCSMKLGKPHLVNRIAEVTVTVTCRHTVQRMAFALGLYRNGRLVAGEAASHNNVKGVTATVGNACRNHNRGSFRSLARYQVKYRGHTFPVRTKTSGPVTLACGF
jgi:hypothetical protein